MNSSSMCVQILVYEEVILTIPFFKCMYITLGELEQVFDSIATCSIPYKSK